MSRARLQLAARNTSRRRTDLGSRVAGVVVKEKVAAGSTSSWSRSNKHGGTENRGVESAHGVREQPLVRSQDSSFGLGQASNSSSGTAAAATCQSGKQEAETAASLARVKAAAIRRTSSGTAVPVTRTVIRGQQKHLDRLR